MHESMKNAKTLGNMPRILPREKANALGNARTEASSMAAASVCAHGEKNYFNENRVLLKNSISFPS